MKRLIVIGADAAGMSAASKVKRTLRDGVEVIAFERGQYTSYAACGMPYLIAGEVDRMSKLIARSAEVHRERGLDVRLGMEVTSIDAENGKVAVRDLSSDEVSEHPYDDLLVATGARPVLPRLEGHELDGIFPLKRLEDAEAIAGAVSSARSAVIVGGGYIGLEMAESLVARGLETTVVEMRDRLLVNVDAPAADLAREQLEEHGVDVRLGTKVQGFEGDGHVRRVRTDGGTIDADLVIVSVGVRPNAELAEAAGVTVGAAGAIVTDDRMATNVPGIWAAGDCCQAKHLVTGSGTWIPLGDTANRMGRVAGANIAGGDARFRGVVGTAVSRVFDLGFGRTGLTVDEARDAGLDVESIHVDASSHAHYMPDASQVRVILNWQPETERILGAQVVARGDAVKRIDALAIAITAGWTLEDLRQADLAYAPPFSPVWDPILTAANVAG